jgi:hypothetical protein
MTSTAPAVVLKMVGSNELLPVFLIGAIDAYQPQSRQAVTDVPILVYLLVEALGFSPASL